MHNEEPILVFYDGWCSVCERSADRFIKLDKQRNVIKCIDLRADPDAAELAGQSVESLAKSLHARLPSGELLSGPPAIRAVMNALGKGWQSNWTRWPIIKPIADCAYRWFAKNRLRYFAKKHRCNDGACGVD